MTYAWCIGFGDAPLDVVALCGELLAPNGPSAATLECAGCPFRTQIDVYISGKIGSRGDTGLLAPLEPLMKPPTRMRNYFLYRNLGRVVTFLGRGK